MLATTWAYTFVYVTLCCEETIAFTSSSMYTHVYTYSVLACGKCASAYQFFNSFFSDIRTESDLKNIKETRDKARKYLILSLIYLH